jgi:phosphatidylserine/phosphatidylglycerophosphate/cardiolipin synthase-like enzyme
MRRSREISSSWTPSTSGPRAIRATLLVDAAHYSELVARTLPTAKVAVWIATANFKTTLVEAPIGSRARARGQFVSLFETLSELAGRGVDVRLLHASAPSGPLARELTRMGSSAVRRRRCPRVHLKMIAVDGQLLYLGSANLTGAGLGAKGEGRRNFEMGILTDSEAMLDAAQARFDRIWRGLDCRACKLRGVCPKPLDTVTSCGEKRRADRSPSAPR